MEHCQVCKKTYDINGGCDCGGPVTDIGEGLKKRSKARKILFLDIDGVLNHSALYSAMALRVGDNKPSDWLDPACVERVNQICDRTGAVIVISSSWRTYLKGHQPTAAVLTERGLRARVIDGTPEILDMVNIGDGTRWTEVRAWLDAHRNITQWVAIDDCDWRGFPEDHFVRTDMRTGITDADVEKTVRLLHSV